MSEIENTPAEELDVEVELEETSEDEVAEVLPTDDDGFITPPEPEADETVVVQDFDPADPGAEIAEPVAVSTREHRTARQVRKDAQRANLDKS